MLGPDAGKPGGAVTGMKQSALLEAWQLPFASDDPQKGGCPDVRGEEGSGSGGLTPFA